MGGAELLGALGTCADPGAQCCDMEVKGMLLRAKKEEKRCRGICSVLPSPTCLYVKYVWEERHSEVFCPQLPSQKGQGLGAGASGFGRLTLIALSGE